MWNSDIFIIILKSKTQLESHYMSLSNQQIIALQYIKGLGIKSVIKIGDLIEESKLQPDSEELTQIINQLSTKNVIPGNIYVSLELLEGFLINASTIIQDSIKNKIGIVSRYDDEFPKSLKHVVDKNGMDVSPILLYYKGDISVLSMPSIAIIGTRTPTKEGFIASKYYSYLFAKQGYNIISGLAKGCDTEAHKGALLSKSGKTTAILAHGLDTIYPIENKNLADDILKKGGILISEYPIGTILERHNLVARNRLQAGLAKATIVIQTGKSGGTLHAAYSTLAAKKPLFCIDYKDNSLMTLDQVIGNKILIEDRGAITLHSKNTNEAIQIIRQHKNRVNYRQGELF